MSTAIEWTNETWNPTTGCDRVSPGCDNCYALNLAPRLKAMGSAKYQTDGDPRTSGPGFGLAIHPDTLDQPLRWRKPRKVFVNSMSDLFHPKVPSAFIASVWRVMERTPQHTYQILTKRPARMRAWVAANNEVTVPTLPNVWLGTSVEDQERADQRIPHLLDTPAAVRFLSCEPLLGPVDLRGLCDHGCSDGAAGFHNHGCAATTTAAVDWVIVGGESGPSARPMHPQWARDLRDQATAAGVPFFFKQWGGRTPKAGGRELDGRTWDAYPEVAT